MPTDAQPQYNVVDAVNVVPEDKILEESTVKKRRFLLIGSCLFGIIMLVVTAFVVLLATRKGTNKTKFDSDGNPTEDDGQAPTEAPTLSNDTKTAVRDFLELLGTQYKGGNDQAADEIFPDTSEPQYKAFTWAWESALEEGIDIQSDRMIQRFALGTFYFATNGDEWVRCGRESTRCDVSREWLTGADECDWYAIECDEEGDVTEIYFRKFLSRRFLDTQNISLTIVFPIAAPNGESSNNIRGTLPDELSFLSKLSVFIIARGPLSGPFPDWSKLSTLQQVLLNQNEFEGSFPNYLLSQNPLLGTIQFNSNNFQGPFLGDLASTNPIAVEDISVNGNDLSGPISSQIGKLNSLRHLDIGSNGISGTLPEELYSLANLINLNVSDTGVSGEISANVGAISKLMEFHARNTDMTGVLPTQLFSLTQLRTLDLSYGTFDGTLSGSFSNLTNLDFAKLDNNLFTGTIPPGLVSLPFLGKL